MAELSELINGSTPLKSKNNYWDNGIINWFTAEDLRNGYEVSNTKKFITKFALENTSIKLVPKDSVLLCCTASIGLIGINKIELTTNQQFNAIVPNKELINSKYLFYFLKSYMSEFKKKASTTTVGFISQKKVKSILVPVPSLQEQEKIVERLDNVFENIDHKISIYKNELSGVDNLFKSTIHSIFVQGEDGYSEVFLKDIAEYFNGLTYSPTDKSDSGTVVLRSSNVQNNVLDFKDIVRVSKKIKDKLFVQNGDVLICSRNGSIRLIGKSAEIKDLPEPMTFGTFMMIVRSDKNNYLKWFFKSSVFKEQISSGENTMINQITRYMLDEIKLQLPNEKVQKEIDNKLTKLYKLCENLRKNLNLKLYKSASLKKSILNKEFSYE